MRKYYFLILPFLLAACLSEKNVDPANATTFTRYYSDGYPNTPVVMEETSDQGFIILVNSNFSNTDADAERDRIQLIKTDQFGHQEWTMYYPSEQLGTATSPIPRWVGSSVRELASGGYLITGEEIQSSISGGVKKQMLLFMIDNAGALGTTKVLTTLSDLSARASVPAPSTSGTGNNFMILAYSSDVNITGNILVGEVSSSSLDTLWTRRYPGGPSVQLINRLYYRNATASEPPYLFFGGYRTYNGSNTNSFVTRTKLNEVSTENGPEDIGEPNFNEYALDFCQRGTDFGVVGYQETGQLGDIFFVPVSSLGSGGEIIPYITEIFDAEVEPDVNVKEEKGNGIIATKDGGFMILGTIDTYTGVLGRGNTDILLLKVNGFGGKMWSKTFGTPDIDGAITVRQTSDGGYAILGRSRIAALQTVILIKTDKNGEVD